MKYLLTFLGGALVGASIALLYAPERGEDLRRHIREALRRNGVIDTFELDEEEIVEQIVAELRERN